MPKPKNRPDSLIEHEHDHSDSIEPLTEPPEEQDPVTENRRDPDPIPEEGGRGEHADDDPITRERVAEDLLD